MENTWKNSWAFCPSCRNLIKDDYNTTSKIENIKRNGITLECVRVHAYCKKCNEEVYVPSINDINAEIVIRAFKNKEK